ncbi:hydroxyethylthiazole kinase [Halobaculum gomorrense]|uniref:Hydroxyethylthiazole kinase n=1 Tax=Halobaculum gomorrense TaxID=43928 RepID=A0A1M5PHK5_9EURY|nr:hydroxyethylthiazole kinase [Halobaculum gomorrense]SHH01252.1 hydroxyethylthiazole kinase [Halobaculum gomorrense]
MTDDGSLSAPDSGSVAPGIVTLSKARAAVRETTPLVNAVTNEVTVNDVANVTLHWGGLPVMSDDDREVADMVASAQGLLLNMGTVSEMGEATMLTAGAAAADHGVPAVVDPVGAGATPTRSRVAERLVTELNPAIVSGNYGEVAALVGDDAEVRGVESVGEHTDIAETAVACARETDAVVVASGETDVVATGERAFEVRSGDQLMGRVVGTGCMLGATLATFAAAIDDPLEASLAGTLAYGLAGEAAAAGEFGEYHGPASYLTAFHDAVAGHEPTTDPAERIREVVA